MIFLYYLRLLFLKMEAMDHYLNGTGKAYVVQNLVTEALYLQEQYGDVVEAVLQSNRGTEKLRRNLVWWLGYGLLDATEHVLDIFEPGSTGLGQALSAFPPRPRPPRPPAPEVPPEAIGEAHANAATAAGIPDAANANSGWRVDPATGRTQLFERYGTFTIPAADVYPELAEVQFGEVIERLRGTNAELADALKIEHTSRVSAERRAAERSAEREATAKDDKIQDLKEGQKEEAQKKMHQRLWEAMKSHKWWAAIIILILLTTRIGGSLVESTYNRIKEALGLSPEEGECPPGKTPLGSGLGLIVGTGASFLAARWLAEEL